MNSLYFSAFGDRIDINDKYLIEFFDWESVECFLWYIKKRVFPSFFQTILDKKRGGGWQQAKQCKTETKANMFWACSRSKLT